MSARLAPAQPPFPAEVEAWLTRTMPAGVPPLVLFTTLARDPRLFQRFMSGGLLDRGQLTLRQRELVIDRVTARCGSEYEWGVHGAGLEPGPALRNATGWPSRARSRPPTPLLLDERRSDRVIFE